MATTMADLLSYYKGANSETTSFGLERGFTSTNIGSKVYAIHPGVAIHLSKPEITAVVIQPFIVEVSSSEEEYLVTSRISNIYELGTTPGQAIINYLRLLASELVWLQQHEENLSPSIHEELRLLQKYVRIA